VQVAWQRRLQREGGVGQGAMEHPCWLLQPGWGMAGMAMVS